MQRQQDNRQAGQCSKLVTLIERYNNFIATALWGNILGMEEGNCSQFLNTSHSVK